MPIAGRMRIASVCAGGKRARRGRV
jgi:hypothetical protein